jgi:hypothetical protein
MSVRTASASVLVVALCAMTPSTASAYVRETTSTGIPLAWRNPQVSMHIFLGDTPPVLTAAQFLEAATLSGQVWGRPFLACSALRLSTTAEPDASADVAYDKRNIIAFRKEAWCAEAAPDTSSDPATCYPHAALAVTTLFKNKNTGDILDADIAFNAVDYTWGDKVALPQLETGNTVDFQNALTHELGHVAGLDHSCYAPADNQPRQLDNTGSPEVDCYNNPSLPDSIAGSTMYPSVSLGDTERRDLAPDDQQGICDIYPTTPSDGCGCATLGRHSSPGMTPSLSAALTAGALVALLMFVLRRRTRGV